MYPKILKTKEDYTKALREVEKLVALDPDFGTKEAEGLDLFSLLVERYESERFPIDQPNPIYAKKFRMNEQGLK